MVIVGKKEVREERKKVNKNQQREKDNEDQPIKIRNCSRRNRKRERNQQKALRSNGEY